ncbi:MAG: tetratricopeptide repeat protein [Vicinamibacterales bacterium]
MIRICWLAAVAVCLVCPPAFAQHESHGGGALSEEQVGTVDFQTSCSPAVKTDMNRAVALLHSFWFPEARQMFEAIAAKDPGCAMAHWGVALTHWGNPFGGLRTPQTIASAKAAIAKGQTTGTPTRREKGYIDAVAAMVASDDVTTQRARVVAYEQAMAQIAKDNPGDVEARIFWGLAVAQTATPTDKTYAANLRAAELLEPMFKKMPSHPGLAHYIIHAYDAPPLAPRGLDAARRYASIAPVVPHALHMPSHTFTRVGYWQQSIDTNRKSAEAARKAGGIAAAGEELHALDYQMYGYLQLADDAAAKAVRDHAASFESGAAGGAYAFALAAIPARYALERQAWAEAAALTAKPAPAAPYTEAITHFAVAIGAARSGDAAAATPSIERLAAIHKLLVAAKDPYWAEQVDIQRRVAEAWQVFAQGDKAKGVELLSAAAAAEDLTDKAAVTPGPIAPARELLGFMLLEAGRAKEAQAAFQATITKEPGRFLGLYGAAQAAEALGDKAGAAALYKKLLEQAGAAQSDRAALMHAKQQTASR